VWPDGLGNPDSAASPPPLKRLEYYLLSKVPGTVSDGATGAPIAGALTLREGAATLRDQVRTKRFLEAIERAVDILDARFPEGDLHVIDAGTGPLPVLAIAAALANPRVRVTALELNPHSATIAKSVIAELGLSDRISVELADATTYTPLMPAHLLMSETMDTALKQEPIVQIFSNLSGYVVDGGIRIPESVTVLGLLYPEENGPTEDFLPTYCIRETVHTGRHYDWSTPDAKVTWRTTEPLPEVALHIRLEEARARYTSRAPEGYFFVTTSEVQVLGDICLRPNALVDQKAPDSLLCLPLRATYRTQDSSTGKPMTYAWFITNKEIDTLAAVDPECQAVLRYQPGAAEARVKTVPEAHLSEE
jgi:hypothetical protein